jgi:tetratricopeptide (TPR) repeat protein
MPMSDIKQAELNDFVPEIDDLVDVDDTDAGSISRPPLKGGAAPVNDLQEAKRLFAEGQLEVALARLQFLGDIQKTNPATLKLKARILSGLGRVDAAASAWKDHADAVPSDVDSRVQLMRIERKRSNVAAAGSHALLVLGLEPEHPEAIKLAVQSIIRQTVTAVPKASLPALGRIEESQLRECLFALETAGRWNIAAEVLAAARREKPGSPTLAAEASRLARELLDRGNQLEQYGSIPAACVLYRAADLVDDGSGEASRRIARIVRPIVKEGREDLKAGNLDSARRRLSEVTLYEPGNLPALSGLARVAELSRDWTSAASLCRRLIDAGENDKRAFLRLAIALERIGEVVESHVALKAVDDPDLQDQVAQLRARLALRAARVAREHYAREDLERSSQSLAVAEQLDGEGGNHSDLRTRINRGLKSLQKAAFERKDFLRSVEVGKELLQRGPSDMRPYVLQARAYAELRQYEASAVHWEVCAGIDATSASVQLGLARALAHLKRNGEALTAARRALELDPSMVKAAELIARIH